MNVHEKLLLQTAVVKRLKTIVDDTRAIAMAELEAGDMKRPRGLGSVSLSEEKTTAKVTGREAFEAHCADTYGSDCVTVDVTGPLEEVLAVLAEHAPHLIGERTYVPAWMEAQELRRAESGELVPGVELSTQSPRLVVRTSQASLDEARQIIAGTPLAVEGADRG